MAKKKPAKRGKKLSARKRTVKDLKATKGGSVAGGRASAVKLD